MIIEHPFRTATTNLSTKDLTEFITIINIEEIDRDNIQISLKEITIKTYENIGTVNDPNYNYNNPGIGVCGGISWKVGLVTEPYENNGIINIGGSIYGYTEEMVKMYNGRVAGSGDGVLNTSPAINITSPMENRWGNTGLVVHDKGTFNSNPMNLTLTSLTGANTFIIPKTHICRLVSTTGVRVSGNTDTDKSRIIYWQGDGVTPWTSGGQHNIWYAWSGHGSPYLWVPPTYSFTFNGTPTHGGDPTFEYREPDDSSYKSRSFGVYTFERDTNIRNINHNVNTVCYGWSFDNWYNATTGGSVQSASNFQLTDDRTLIARYNQSNPPPLPSKNISITFNDNLSQYSEGTHNYNWMVPGIKYSSDEQMTRNTFPDPIIKTLIATGYQKNACGCYTKPLVPQYPGTTVGPLPWNEHLDNNGSIHPKYQFLGWYYETTGLTLVKPTDAIYDNIIVYAKWGPRIPI